MTHTDEFVLTMMYVAVEKGKELGTVHSYFSKRNDLGDLIRAMIMLERLGYVTVPSESWSYGDSYNPVPVEIVMTGVKLTNHGRQKARQLIPIVRERLK
ncbi:hypothetical protein [Brevibacillus sp. SIMBA_040]|uniref:hypothetical protein n=1 Tax=unclassified Brevibacillus TaxID=2684853 RepID=UPI00397D1841